MPNPVPTPSQTPSPQGRSLTPSPVPPPLGGTGSERDKRTDPHPVPRPVPGPRNWLHQGACLHHPPDLFHPASRNAKATTAKTICNTCPVLTPCRTYALTDRSLKGVWGATTEADRATIRATHEQEQQP